MRAQLPSKQPQRFTSAVAQPRLIVHTVSGFFGRALARATHAGAWQGSEGPQSASDLQGSPLFFGAGSLHSTGSGSGACAPELGVDEATGATCAGAEGAADGAASGGDAGIDADVAPPQAASARAYAAAANSPRPVQGRDRLFIIFQDVGCRCSRGVAAAR